MEGRAILSLSPINVITIGLIGLAFYAGFAALWQVFQGQTASGG